MTWIYMIYPMTPTPPHRHRAQVLGSRIAAPPVEVAQRPRLGATGGGSSIGWRCGPGIPSIDSLGYDILLLGYPDDFDILW